MHRSDGGVLRRRVGLGAQRRPRRRPLAGTRVSAARWRAGFFARVLHDASSLCVPGRQFRRPAHQSCSTYAQDASLYPSLRTARPQLIALSRSATLSAPQQRRCRRDRKQNCMPTETRPPRSFPSPPPRRRRDMPRADRGRQQLLDDLGYVQPIFRAGNSGDCTILKSVAVLLVVIGLVVFVGRFAE